jgi:Rps23 Pro-64 3,4-dihydroxylase Tpa1-like proline 4-hydroxylase
MFINTQWHVDWAGELHFFNDDLSEITKSVIPKGGRAVVFDSSIAHSARSPSILSPVPRYTLTIKAFLE